MGDERVSWLADTLERRVRPACRSRTGSSS